MTNEIIPSTEAEVLTQQQIESFIYTVRGVQVMLDRDLAMLYKVETKYLNRQVKRNATRFPEDFMFKLTKEEWDAIKKQVILSYQNWTSQNASSNAEVESLRCQNVTSKENENLRCQNVTSSWGGALSIVMSSEFTRPHQCSLPSHDSTVSTPQSTVNSMTSNSLMIDGLSLMTPSITLEHPSKTLVNAGSPSLSLTTQESKLILSENSCSLVTVSPQLYTYNEWKAREFTPYYENVEHDKIVIYES